MRRKARPTVSIRLSGDGITACAQIAIVFDESRLELISATARNGGACPANASARVIVFSPNVSGVLANAATTYCDLNLRARANAVPGAANLQGTEAQCYAGSGSTVANCSVVNNAVMVIGTRH
jgi:hypothetical protein